MSRNPTIIAIGGGGFTHNKDPELDNICLSYAQRRAGIAASGVFAEPSIGFVGLASDDDLTKIKQNCSYLSNIKKVDKTLDSH